MCRLEQNEEFLNGNFARDKMAEIGKRLNERGGNQLNDIRQIQDSIYQIASELYDEELETAERKNMGIVSNEEDMRIIEEISQITSKAMNDIASSYPSLQEIKNNIRTRFLAHK